MSETRLGRIARLLTDALPTEEAAQSATQADRLRRLIKFSGMSQNAFARRIGVSRSIICRVLSGERGVDTSSNSIALGALKALALPLEYWDSEDPDPARFIVAPSVGTDRAFVLDVMERTGWSQSELARRAGVNSAAICRVANGKTPLGRFARRGIGDALIESGSTRTEAQSDSARLVALTEFVQGEARLVGVEAASPGESVRAMRVAIERLRAVLEGR